MNKETYNEIDLLLRKLGRANQRVPESSGNGSTQSTVHMDADELNAFAENALPPATRARYTDHLADCGHCRQLVSRLTQVSGLVREEAAKPNSANWLKTFLASLFAPMVLRYAVPALGLLVIASIGFFVFRDSGSMQIAQKRSIEPPVSKAADETPSSSPTNSLVAKSDSDSVQKTRVTNGEAAQAEKNEVKLADDAKREEKEAPHRQEPVTVTDQVTIGASANAPSSPEPVARKYTEADAQKQTAPQAAEAKPQATPQSRSEEVSKANEQPAERRSAKAASSIGALAAADSNLKKARSGPAAKTADAEEDKGARDRRDKDEGETTSVAGHRFRKTGSVWIDVEYSSSQATTNVARSSEQYRALVADEPGIRSIADQLHGEVIVVWKGRAYRIR
ncbi:MAG TPA: zf-HC2 domain-containing protein [Pyrinomonadaceae bacterium]|nr:zf-HC2 domain-containing protein [Pyrinomonadaceae bacterium]